MPHVDHPEVVRERIVVHVDLPDPPKRVLEVETKMPISHGDAGFDQDKYDALVDAVRVGIDRASADEARIVRV